MKEVYIIRHGETDLNKQGIIQGRGINSDLNETGRLQAAAFFNRYKSIPFDKIYTSALKRTHQTVQQFIDMGISWQQLSGLDELGWGEWEGKPSSPESIVVFKKIAEEWQSANYDAKFVGGESPNDVLLRLKPAIEEIKSHHEEKCILMCIHGRVMRILLCYLLNKPLAEMADFPHQNTTLYRLRLSESGQFTLIDFNNTEHLISQIRE